MSEKISQTPWDSRVYGFHTYEIQVPSEKVLEKVRGMQGHFTVKVEPLSSKKLLHDYGFYYCDTLIEPYCSRYRFVYHHHAIVSVSAQVSCGQLAKLCQDAFSYDRFHRDFNLEPALADQRYASWARELCQAGTVLGLFYDGELAGFFAFSGEKILLHALSAKFRGRGLAKFFWSAACEHLFDAGARELVSSISASNMAVLNLYATLGFRFRNPKDVYHLLNGPVLR